MTKSKSSTGLVEGKNMGSEIIIIGGGIAGLTTAWFLTKAGHTPTLIDFDPEGKKATLAAAGMICPVFETQFEEQDLSRLFLESHSLWDSFAHDVIKQSGEDIDFQKNGSMLVAIDKDDEKDLLRHQNFYSSIGLETTFLDRSDVLKKVPSINPKISGALHAVNDYAVDNQKLAQALTLALKKRGVNFITEKKVTALDIVNNKICGLWLEDIHIKCSQILLATGVEKNISNLSDYIPLPIRGVKGQALLLKQNSKQFLNYILRSMHRYPAYLVPRNDGHLVIGATSEEKTDFSFRAGNIMDLFWGASNILPGIEEMDFVKTWVGLRPALKDHKPLLGPSPIEGVSLALGLYRHGILLAPMVGSLMADFVLQKKYSPYFDIFGYTDRTVI